MLSQYLQLIDNLSVSVEVNQSLLGVSIINEHDNRAGVGLTANIA